LAVGSTPLTNSAVEDMTTWHYRMKGLYSAKTGYGVALGIEKPDLGESTAGHRRKLWNIKLPPKIKFFLNLEGLY
jgi:hypothetical protein